MTQKTEVTVTCDICGGGIVYKSIQHIDARVYGFDFHYSCLLSVDGTVLGLLLDDVTSYVRGTDGSRLYWNKEITQ